jgi:hypothetical protein
MPYCIKCGTSNFDVAFFCFNCGAKIFHGEKLTEPISVPEVVIEEKIVEIPTAEKIEVESVSEPIAEVLVGIERDETVMVEGRKPDEGEDVKKTWFWEKVYWGSIWRNLSFLAVINIFFAVIVCYLLMINVNEALKLNLPISINIYFYDLIVFTIFSVIGVIGLVNICVSVYGILVKNNWRGFFGKVLIFMLAPSLILLGPAGALIFLGIGSIFGPYYFFEGFGKLRLGKLDKYIPSQKWAKKIALIQLAIFPLSAFLVAGLFELTFFPTAQLLQASNRYSGLTNLSSIPFYSIFIDIILFFMSAIYWIGECMFLVLGRKEKTTKKLRVGILVFVLFFILSLIIWPFLHYLNRSHLLQNQQVKQEMTTTVTAKDELTVPIIIESLKNPSIDALEDFTGLDCKNLSEIKTEDIGPLICVYGHLKYRVFVSSGTQKNLNLVLFEDGSKKTILNVIAFGNLINDAELKINTCVVVLGKLLELGERSAFDVMPGAEMKVIYFGNTMKCSQ